MPQPASDTGVLVFGELLAHLRRSGFLIGVDEYLHVQAVLDRAGDYTKEDLKTLLCPLIATSKEQQRLFHKAFDTYFELSAAAAVAEPDERSREEEEERRRGGPPKRRRYVVSALALVTLVGLLVFFLMMNEARRGGETQPIPPTPTPIQGTLGNTNGQPPAETPTPTPTPTPPPPPGGKVDSFAQLIRLASALAAVIIIAVAGWYRINRRNYMRRRQAEREPPLTYDLEVGDPPQKIYATEKFYRAARLLRRRLAGEFHRLDIPSTIGATVESVGYPSLRYKPDTLTPEYLLLIERESSHDHRARLFDELAKALAREDLYVERYFYEGDPRLCRDESGERHLTLAELQTKHRDHRVLVFGDGAGLVDQTTGGLAAWTSLFSGWEALSLHTPEHPSSWGMREVSLSTRFAVMPATVEGLLGLAHHYEAPLRTELGQWLREETGLPSTPPDIEGVAAVGELREYLGENCFDWLCACAVHTELQWNLTLRLGSMPELGKELLTEENLLRLFALPWFRGGFIPDGVRVRLVEELEKKAEKARAVREAVVELLSKKPPAPKTYAADAYAVFMAVQRWLLQREDKARLRELLRVARSLPRAQVVQDPALIPALQSAPGHSFDRQLPAGLRRFLYRDGIPAFGVKPGLLVALLALAVLFAWMSAPSVASALVEEPPQAAVTPSPSPTPSTTPTPELTPTPYVNTNVANTNANANRNGNANTNANTNRNTNTNTTQPSNGNGNLNINGNANANPTPTPTPSPCPSVSLSCPGGSREDAAITFTANISGGDENVTPTYNWTVSAGFISSGQGTSSITVETKGVPLNSTVTATVEIGGYEVTCSTSSSCTTPINGVEQPRQIDGYGNINSEEETARLDNYAIELMNDPAAQGYVFCYGGRTGRTGEAQSRCDRAKNYLVNTRGLDASRLVTVDGGFRENLTVEIWLVPSGAPPPGASPTVDPSEVRPVTPRPTPRRRGRSG